MLLISHCCSFCYKHTAIASLKHTTRAQWKHRPSAIVVVVYSTNDRQRNNSVGFLFYPLPHLYVRLWNYFFDSCWLGSLSGFISFQPYNYSDCTRPNNSICFAVSLCLTCLPTQPACRILIFALPTSLTLTSPIILPTDRAAAKNKQEMNEHFSVFEDPPLTIGFIW